MRNSTELSTGQDLGKSPTARQAIRNIAGTRARGFRDPEPRLARALRNLLVRRAQLKLPSRLAARITDDASRIRTRPLPSHDISAHGRTHGIIEDFCRTVPSPAQFRFHPALKSGSILGILNISVDGNSRSGRSRRLWFIG